VSFFTEHVATAGFVLFVVLLFAIAWIIAKLTE
jgi:hypothetical protein